VHVIKMSMKTGACENNSHGPMVKDFTSLLEKWMLKPSSMRALTERRVLLRLGAYRTSPIAFTSPMGSFDNNISFPTTW
jgi:hypothetical protein